MEDGAPRIKPDDPYGPDRRLIVPLNTPPGFFPLTARPVATRAEEVSTPDATCLTGFWTTWDETVRCGLSTTFSKEALLND